MKSKQQIRRQIAICEALIDGVKVAGPDSDLIIKLISFLIQAFEWVLDENKKQKHGQKKANG